MRTRERLTALMFTCGKQVGLSRLPLNRSASVSYDSLSDEIIIHVCQSYDSRCHRLYSVKRVI
jgi:hypothetical protein